MTKVLFGQKLAPVGVAGDLGTSLCNRRDAGVWKERERDSLAGRAYLAYFLLTDTFSFFLSEMRRNHGVF